MLCIILPFSGKILLAQNGTLKGLIKDLNAQPIPFANIALFKEAKIITGCISDIDGNYKLTSIPTGIYDIQVQCVGYTTQQIKQVSITDSNITFLDITLQNNSAALNTVTISDSRIQADQSVQSITWSAADIKSMPSRNATEVMSMTGGVNSSNGNISVRGSRGGALVIIDGVKTRGGANIPQAAIKEVDVIMEGTPANIGDIPPINQPFPPYAPPQPSTPIIVYNPAQQFPIQYNANDYTDFKDNDFLSSGVEPLSTFSVDVDKASYSLVRKFIKDGVEPARGAVRLEEMINYFDYNYPDPIDEHPFNIITELTECPWNKDSKILKLALQGKRIQQAELPPSVFTFLIDVSGSMNDPYKLPLVKASLLKLMESLRPQDKVGIVVYAGAAGVVLEPRSADKKSIIVTKIMEMEAGGSTAGGQGIQLAYKLAEEHFAEKGNNRIILCTDGDFNVGISSESELGDLIEKERQKGIFLTVLGFGMGNYKDSKLELLADKGNGNYAYIDDYSEAEKFLGKEFAGSMYTIAKDVKIQIEFNPEHVKSYRLIGYENRVLQAQDFNDDKKDAGEIGAGHTVTALYEIRADEKFCKKVDSLKYQRATNILEQASAEIATVKFRYKKPDGINSILIQKTLGTKTEQLQSADENTRFAIAVAAFGMILRKSEYIKDMPLGDIIKLASGARTYDKENLREDFITMMKDYKRITVVAKK